MIFSTQKFKPKRGCWSTEHGKTLWKEYKDQYGNDFELIEPLLIEGISKTAQFDIIFVTDSSNANSLTGTVKNFWKQSVSVKLSETVSPNVYLKTVDNQTFVCDFEPLGQTFICPLESQDWGLIVTKSEPEKITQLEAKQLLDNGALGFGYVQISNGHIDYARTC